MTTMTSDDQTTDIITSSKPQEFTIPKSLSAALASVIDRANRRLERAGVEERFIYTKTTRLVADKDRPGVFNEVLDIILNTPVISAAGYKFLAVLSREENGFIVRSATNVELGGWQPDAMLCDHCGQRRRRNKTYLVETPEGELMQVGSTCVKPLLGLTPAGLWALMYDIDIPAYDDNGSVNSGADVHIPVNYIIALALGLSRMGDDFVTQSAVTNGYDGQSTSSAVKTALFDTSSRTQDLRATQARTAREILAEHGELVDEIIAGAQMENPDTDYQQNMNIIMSAEYAQPRNVGYVVSAISSWNRNRRIAEADTARQENATEGFIGEVDEKLRNITVTVTEKQNSYTTDFHGDQVLASRLNFRDEAGHEIVWWASRVIDEVEKGDKATITSATVKKQKTYRGVDQTELTRVRLRKAE